MTTQNNIFKLTLKYSKKTSVSKVNVLMKIVLSRRPAYVLKFDSTFVVNFPDSTYISIQKIGV